MVKTNLHRVSLSWRYGCYPNIVLSLSIHPANELLSVYCRHVSRISYTTPSDNFFFLLAESINYRNYFLYCSRNNLKSGGPDSIPGGVRNFNSYPGMGVCPWCSVLCCLRRGSWHCAATHSGRPALVLWSIDNCSPYRHSTHGHLGCKS